MFRPRARYFPWMESTQRSPGLRTRTQSARLEKGLNLFGAGVNLGPFRPPPAAARAGQIRRPLFSTLRLSCALPFRLRLLRSSHHVGPDALIGPRKSGAPQSPLIRPCGPPPPLGGEGLLGAFYRLPPLGGKLASEARLMRGRTVEGREILRPRARYFPWMESTQRSPGLRTRTQSARLEKGLNLFGAGVNLGPFPPPPAAARANQIRCPSFSTLRLSCALPFRLYLVGAAPCGGPGV